MDHSKLHAPLAALTISLIATPLLAGNVFAPPPEPVVAPPPVEAVAAAPSVWSGAYIGLFVLRASSTADNTDDDIPDIDYDSNGYGIRGGYDMAFGRFIVGGFADYARLNGDATVEENGFHTHEINSESTLGLRVGYDMDRALPYLFYGLARANGTWTYDDDGGTSDDQTHSGNAMGAGVEFATGYGNTTVDLQYRRADYGTATYDLTGPWGDLEADLKSSRFSLGVNMRF